MVADEVYDDKATVDIYEEKELTKALKPYAAGDVQLTCDEGFSRYVFHVLKQWMRAVYLTLDGSDSKHCPAGIPC